MNFGNYTQKSLEAIRNAQQIAVENNNQQLEQLHVLLALLRQEDGLIPQLLRRWISPWRAWRLPQRQA